MSLRYFHGKRKVVVSGGADIDTCSGVVAADIDVVAAVVDGTDLGAAVADTDLGAAVVADDDDVAGSVASTDFGAVLHDHSLMAVPHMEQILPGIPAAIFLQEGSPARAYPAFLLKRYLWYFPYISFPAPHSESA